MPSQKKTLPKRNLPKNKVLDFVPEKTEELTEELCSIFPSPPLMSSTYRDDVNCT